MTTPTAVAPAPPPPPRPVAPTRRRFTVAEYYAMAEAGILARDERVELLDGDVIAMPPIGNWHASNVDLFTNTFPAQLHGRAVVRVQNPVRLNDGSEPQPDVMLLRWRDDFYRDGHPGPADVLLLIEVSDSSVDFDRNEKLSAYAAAGIPEVWIVNRPTAASNPIPIRPAMNTSQCGTMAPAKSISPQAFPDVVLQVDQIIPPETD